MYENLTLTGIGGAGLAKSISGTQVSPQPASQIPLSADPHLLRYTGFQGTPICRCRVYGTEELPLFLHWTAYLKRTDAVKILIVIGHAWNEDMADPHGFADLIQVSGEGQNIFVGMAGESAVLFRIDVF